MPHVLREPDARSRSYRAGKRVFDVAVASILLLAVAPLFPVIALLIVLDSPGPVFFVQQRVGQHGRGFGMLKFRSMVPGEAGSAPRRAKPDGDDPRITRVGRWLRRTSLDELPQLINVIRGEMSLVGPRPEILELVLAHYQPWQYQRFTVPQGMTGWWQVTGRGRKYLLDHTEDDLYYIAHASFWLDLKILVRTIPAVLRRDGAF